MTTTDEAPRVTRLPPQVTITVNEADLYELECALVARLSNLRSKANADAPIVTHKLERCTALLNAVRERD